MTAITKMTKTVPYKCLVKDNWNGGQLSAILEDEG